MKIIAIILTLMFLATPACAWEIVDGNVTNMSEDDLYRVVDVAKGAGMAGNGALYQMLYSRGELPWKEYSALINYGNQFIREWNLLLKNFEPDRQFTDTMTEYRL